MVYVLVYSCPFGVEPTVYTQKPQIESFFEIDGELFSDPQAPNVEEFESKFLARLFIKNNSKDFEKINVI